MAENNLRKIKDKEKELAPRVERQKGDKDRYLLKSFTLRDHNNKKVPNSLSINLPFARLYADYLIGALLRVGMQPRVEGDGLSNKDKSMIEGFYINLLLSIDRDLVRRGEPHLKSFVSKETLLSGTIAARTTLRKNKEGLYKPHVLPIYAVDISYEFGDEDLAWVSCKFTKTKEQIVLEYPQFKDKAASTGKTTVREYWDAKVKELYFDDKFIDQEGHDYGKPPFSIVESSAGALFRDENYLKNKSESIYGGVRELLDEINRHASIIATIEMLSFRGSKLFKNELGASGVLENPEGMGQIYSVGLRDTIENIPIQDVYNASRLHQSNLLTVWQQATLPSVAYGSLAIPLSSIAITQLFSKVNALIAPRLEDMNLFYSQLVRNYYDFYTNQKFETSLGREGIEVKYTPKELTKRHFIEFEIKSFSREEELANLSIAQGQKNLGLSQEYILDNSIKVQDLHAELNREREEQAGTDMAIATYNQVIALIDKGDQVDDKDEKERYYTMAAIKKAELGTILGQMNIPAISNQGKGQKTNEPILPLFGGGASRGQQNIDGEMTELPEEAEQRAESRAVTVRRQTNET